MSMPDSAQLSAFKWRFKQMHLANGGSKDGFLTIHHRTDKGRAFSGSNPTVIQEVFGLRQVLHSVLVPFLSLLVKGEKNLF